MDCGLMRVARRAPSLGEHGGHMEQSGVDRRAMRRSDGGWIAASAALMAMLCIAGAPRVAPAAAARGPLDLRLNDVQVLGSHNSYHIQPVPELIDLYLLFDPQAPALEYTHRPLREQFAGLGIRQIELDIFADPAGGLHAEPLSAEVLAGEVVHFPALDPPGMKVLHIADIDADSTCPTLVACLSEVKAWSDANPAHLPIMILIEAKADPPPDLPLGFVQPIPFDAALLDDLDAEIRAVFPAGQVLTPDAVRGGSPTLEEAVLRTGWPTLRAARGKVLFALDNGGAVREAYVAAHPSLAGRMLFVDAAPGTPEAAFAKLNDSIADGPRIAELVRAGYIVRTRADADTVEARTGDVARREAALASGAQFVSTDYPELGPFGTDYVARIPGDHTARCNPVRAPNGCDNAALENLTGEQPVAGRRLVVRQRGGRWKLVVAAVDPAIDTPLPESPDDPALAGAVLTVENPTTGERGTFTLPAGTGWRRLGRGATDLGYAYRDRAGRHGPCRRVTIRRGRDLDATCAGARGAAPLTLDEPRQGGLAVTLRLGGGTVHCASFGGRIARDAPARDGKRGVFSANDAPAAACPGASPARER